MCNMVLEEHQAYVQYAPAYSCSYWFQNVKNYQQRMTRDDVSLESTMCVSEAPSDCGIGAYSRCSHVAHRCEYGMMIDLEETCTPYRQGTLATLHRQEMATKIVAIHH